MDHEKNFNLVAEKIARRLKRENVGLYEVYYTAARRLAVESEGREIEDFKFSEPYGAALRVIVDGGMGFSFSTRPDDEAVEAMVKNAVQSARHSTPDEHYAFADPPARLPETGPIFDEKINKVPLAEKLDRAMAVEEGAISADPRVQRVRGARYAETEARVFMMNSLGLSVQYAKSVVSAQVMATAQENDDQEMAYDVDYSITYDGLDPFLVGRRAGEAAAERIGAKKAPTGRFTALFTNEVAAELLGVLASSFLAENVLKGKSILAGKEGAMTASKLVTVVDDGIMPGGIAGAPVDDEGVVRGRVEVIKDGVLMGFLYDLVSARRAGKRPTGSSVRDSVMSPPTPGTANLFIVPGDGDPEKLLEGVGRGVVITELMGVHTANPVTGDFSVGASGFVCDNGKKGAPFKEGAMAGNLVTLFERVVAVGSDLRFFGDVGAPSLVVTDVDISGK